MIISFSRFPIKLHKSSMPYLSHLDVCAFAFLSKIADNPAYTWRFPCLCALNCVCVFVLKRTIVTMFNMLHAVEHPLSPKQSKSGKRKSKLIKKKRLWIDIMMNSSHHDFHPIVAPGDSFSPRALKSSDAKGFCIEIHFIAFTEFHQSLNDT